MWLFKFKVIPGGGQIRASFKILWGLFDVDQAMAITLAKEIILSIIADVLMMGFTEKD